VPGATEGAPGAGGGFADAYGFTGPPGYYGDNSGFLKLWIGFLG
jgi:hypothetical protein